MRFLDQCVQFIATTRYTVLIIYRWGRHISDLSQ